MALLGGLRLLQRHVGPLEIGAGILHVVVEEELVEFAGEIVVALHVAFGADCGVHLMQAAEGVAHAFDGLRPHGVDAARSHILENDAQQVERIALDDIELAVHEGFGSGEHRIERDRALGCWPI